MAYAIRVACCLIFSLMCSSVVAQGAYLGGGLSLGHLQVSPLEQKALQGAAGSWNMVFGYALSPRFSIDTGFFSTKRLSSGMKVNSFYAAGAGRFQWSGNWYAHGRLGLVGHRLSQPKDVLALGKDRTSLMWSAGAEYLIDERWSLFLDYYDLGRVTDQVSLKTLNMGVRYELGDKGFSSLSRFTGFPLSR